MESRVQGEWTRWADLISADRTRCTRSNSRSSTSGSTATGAGSAVPAAPTANPDHDLLTFCDTHTGSKTPLVGIDGFAMPMRRRVSADALGWAGGPVSRASMSCPCARKAPADVEEGTSFANNAHSLGWAGGPTSCASSCSSNSYNKCYPMTI